MNVGVNGVWGVLILAAESSRNKDGESATLGVTTDFPTFQTDAELAPAGLAFAEAPGNA